MIIITRASYNQGREQAWFKSWTLKLINDFTLRKLVFLLSFTFLIFKMKIIDLARVKGVLPIIIYDLSQSLAQTRCLLSVFNQSVRWKKKYHKKKY